MVINLIKKMVFELEEEITELQEDRFSLIQQEFCYGELLI